MTHADRVREHARLVYIEPARRRHETTIRIVAGEVQRAVRLSNRVSLVCQALKSRKFLDENHLVLEKWEGPPSGLSTTVAFTYRLLDEVGQTQARQPIGSFLRLRGMGNDVFQAWAEVRFIPRERQREREQFYGPGEDL